MIIGICGLGGEESDFFSHIIVEIIVRFLSPGGISHGGGGGVIQLHSQPYLKPRA